MEITKVFVIKDLDTDKYFITYRADSSLTKNIEDATSYISEEAAVKAAVEEREYDMVLDNITKFKVESYYIIK